MSGSGARACVGPPTRWLARQISASPHLEYCGIQAYWGHLQQVRRFAERRRVVLQQGEIVRATWRRCARPGLPPAIVTGGGTGRALIDAELGLFTELQPGSYLFMDSSYSRGRAVAGRRVAVRASLFVRANVVSVNRPQHAVINAGLKSFATDFGIAVRRARRAGGHHLQIHGRRARRAGLRRDQQRAAGARRPGVECVVSHCDPTVNLYDFLHCRARRSCSSKSGASMRAAANDGAHANGGDRRRRGRQRPRRSTCTSSATR